MRLGLYRFAPQSDFQIKCAYAGCKDNVSLAKSARIVMRVGDQDHEVGMAGLSDPIVVEPPQTRLAGADIPVDRTLDMQWFRLDFVGYNEMLGDIEVGLARHPNARFRTKGQVVSLSNLKLRSDRIYMKSPAPAPTGTFFPALNDNEFYFQIVSRKLNEVFLSDEPVRNQAVISRMPPLESEYEFKEPVRFAPQNNPNLPLLDIIECRVGMATLQNVELAVEKFVKTGPTTATLGVTALNRSTTENVQICVMCESASNIAATPRRQFIKLDRDPVTFVIDLDTRKAFAEGTVTIQVILFEPFKSRGSNNLIIDRSEIERGAFDETLPPL